MMIFLVILFIYLLIGIIISTLAHETLRKQQNETTLGNNLLSLRLAVNTENIKDEDITKFDKLLEHKSFSFLFYMFLWPITFF